METISTGIGVTLAWTTFGLGLVGLGLFGLGYGYY